MGIMGTTTITVNDNSMFIAGGAVTISCLDRRWWKRVLYFTTFRHAPIKQEMYKVISINDGNELTIEQELM
jgi:hypothetical protein